MLPRNLTWKQPLERQQGVVEQINRCLVQAQTMADEWSKPQVEVRLEILQSLWHTYQKYDQEVALQHHDNDQIILILGTLQDEAVLAYADAKHILSDRLEGLIREQEPRKPVKASRIVVAQFNGSHADWPAWCAQFTAKVNDTQLEYHEKIDILAKSITDDAASCVGPLINRDKAEYDRAWAALINRYDNEYQLVIAHVNAILNLKAATKDSAKDLRAIVDTINQQLRLLQRYNFQIDAWDPIVVVTILRKLDAETLKEWEKAETRRKMPKLDQLLAFIERRIVSLTNWTDPQASEQRANTAVENRQRSFDKHDRDRKAHGSHGQRQQSSSAATSSGSDAKSGKSDQGSGNKPLSPPCLMCGNPHRLWNCRKFGQMPLAERASKLGEWKVCPNCLIDKHSSDTCPRSGCPFCDNAKHNSCMCPNRNANRVHHARGRKRKVESRDRANQRQT